MKLNLVKIKNFAKLHSRPIIGKFAYFLWNLASSQKLDYQVSRELYETCGYVPFKGYPLTKVNKGET